MTQAVCKGASLTKSGLVRYEPTGSNDEGSVDELAHKQIYAASRSRDLDQDDAEKVSHRRYRCDDALHCTTGQTASPTLSSSLHQP